MPKKALAKEDFVQTYWDFDQATYALKAAITPAPDSGSSVSLASPGEDDFFSLGEESSETFVSAEPDALVGESSLSESPQAAAGDRSGGDSVAEPIAGSSNRPRVDSRGGSVDPTLDGAPPADGWRAKRLREGLGRFYPDPFSSYKLPAGIKFPERVEARQNANLAALQTLRRLQSEKRLPTPREQLDLALYTGHAGLVSQFYRKPFEDAGYSLSAYESTLPIPVVERLQQIISRYEPNTSASLLHNSNWLPHLARPEFQTLFKNPVIGTSVNDRLAQQIGSILYPGVFTSNRLEADESYPAIFNFILNTSYHGGSPFTFVDRYPLVQNQVAAQFLTSLEKAAPGGVICTICPASSFIDNAGTESTRNGLQNLGVLEASYRVKDGRDSDFDIIIFRKYRENEEPKSSHWIQPDAGSPSFNHYYYYDQHSAHVQPDGLSESEASQWMSQALALVPQGYLAAKEKKTALVPPLGVTPLEINEGCLVLKDDRVVRRTAHGTSLIRWSVKDDEERVRLLLPVRDALVGLVNLHQEHSSPQVLFDQRQVLTAAYDRFVEKYGPVSKLENISVFHDPHRHLVLMTERNYDLLANTADKSEVFTKDIFSSARDSGFAEDARHAYLLSLREYNRVDLEYMAKLTRLTPDELIEDLEGQIFLDPKTNQYVSRVDYFSGDLNETIARAKLAFISNPRMAENIRALNNQMEKDFSDVEVGLGSPVVPVKLVAQFFSTYIGLSQDRFHLSYSQSTDRYQIKGRNNLKGTQKSKSRGQQATGNPAHNALTTSELNNARGVDGVPHAMAHRLLLCALHGRIPAIKEKQGDKFVRTPKTIEQTAEAIAKIAQMKEKFIAWVKEDPKRMALIQARYRRSIGGYAKPVYQGDHLTDLPGANPTIELRPYQRIGAARIVSSPTSYLAFQVGYGKTFALAAGIMEARRLGVAKRPVIFTMDGLVDGFAVQFKRLYPSARIYTARSEDFVKVPGKNKVADHIPDVLRQIASDSYDVSILSANLLPHLPMAANWTDLYENKLHRERLTKSLFRAETPSEFKRINEILAQSQSSFTPAFNPDRLTFDRLGIDLVACDEFDEIGQAIPVATSLNISGLPSRDNASSKKLLNIYDMIRMTGGRLVSATGTPLRNSVAEIWIVSRFHGPELLERQGAMRFDRWYPTFADTTTQLEVHVDSRTMRMKTRMGPFRNMRDMMLTVSQYADFVNNSNYTLEGIPKLAGGKPIVETCESYPALEQYIDALVLRAEHAHLPKKTIQYLSLPNGRSVKIPPNDNLLAVCTEGRKAALDLRMIASNEVDHPGNKVNRCVANVVADYHAKADERATQMIFCEIGVENNDPKRFSTYRELKRKLIEHGIPTREIRFAQEFSTQRENLERALRSGAVRVLIGNTRSMGAGINGQDRLYALHHLDLTYTARDIDQREGRILRPGNRFEEVKIYNYVQKGSFDAVMFEHNSFKRKILLQLVSFDLSLNRCDDIDGQTATLEEMKASACRDPVLRAAMEKRSVIHHEIQKLTILDRDEMQYALGAKENLALLNKEIAHRETILLKLREDANRFTERPDFSIQLAPIAQNREKKDEAQNNIAGYITFSTRTAANIHFNQLLRFYRAGQVGIYRGTPLALTEDTGRSSDLSWSRVQIGNISQFLGGFAPLNSLLGKIDEIPKTLALAEVEMQQKQVVRDELFKASTNLGNHKVRLGELRNELVQIDVMLGSKKCEVIAVGTKIVEAPGMEEEPAAAEKLLRGRTDGKVQQNFTCTAIDRAPESNTQIAGLTLLPAVMLSPRLRGEVNTVLNTFAHLDGVADLSPCLAGNFALLTDQPELLAERRLTIGLNGNMVDLEKLSRTLMEKRPAGWDNPRFRQGEMIVNASAGGSPLELRVILDGLSNDFRGVPDFQFALPVVPPAQALGQMEREALTGRATAASLCNLLLHPDAAAIEFSPLVQEKLKQWIHSQPITLELSARVHDLLDERERKRPVALGGPKLELGASRSLGAALREARTL